MEFPEVIELNVGGRHLSTFLSTLIKYPDSMLAAMFSGRHHVTKDKDGRYFIDADGEIFSHLLNFLRFETMPPTENVIQVKQYAEYFGIDQLKTRLNKTVLPTRDSIVAQWKSNIPGYAESLSFVKEQLITCNILDGYIIMYLRLRNKCNGFSQCHSRRKESIMFRDLEGKTVPYVADRLEVQLHKDCDLEKHAKTMLTLLSDDLKQCGFCTEASPLWGCCFYGKCLKLM